MKPPYYVDLQRATNWKHRDGRIEHPNETAEAYAPGLKQMQALDPSGPQSILDVGCRTGYSLVILQKLYPNAHVEGVDIVPEFVAIASERGEATLADAHELPFEEREFSWTLCIGTFEHFYDGPRAAKELARVTDRLLFVTCDLRPESKKGRSDFLVSQDPSYWRAFMEATGFHLHHERNFGWGCEFLLRRADGEG